jgi:hypothetical protein
MTIHNLTIASMSRAFSGLGWWTKIVRIFFRPCDGANGDSSNPVLDHYCYNHIGHPDPGIINGKYNLQDEVLVAPQGAEFIDKDWVHGTYDPHRDDRRCKRLNSRSQSKVDEIPEDASARWGRKSYKMSREVEACRCCGKHQLGAIEVCRHRTISSEVSSLTIESSIKYVDPK